MAQRGIACGQRVWKWQPVGGLIGLGIPEFEAKRYEARLQKGGILLSVHCDTSEEIDEAKDILKRTGGEDVSSTGEASVDSTKSGRDIHRTASGGNR